MTDTWDGAALREVMVDTQVRPNDVTKFPIIAAMLHVPREAYVPAGREAVAYGELAIPLGGGREIAEPRTLAKMLDALDLGREDEVLVIGAGLGYACAVVAHVCRSVVAVEEDADLAAEAEANLSAQGVDNAVVLHGSMVEGAPKAAPFDAILIEGGVDEVPAALTDQLAEGGRVCAVFVDGAGRLGEARLGRRAHGRISWASEFNAGAARLPGFAVEPGFIF
jgi:protein-L-isoaspartate(D-aspartate) O-methyltransferase